MWQPEEDIERRSCMCMFSFIGKTKHHVAADCGTLHPYREFFKKKNVHTSLCLQIQLKLTEILV